MMIVILPMLLSMMHWITTMALTNGNSENVFNDHDETRMNDELIINGDTWEYNNNNYGENDMEDNMERDDD